LHNEYVIFYEINFFTLLIVRKTWFRF